MIYVLPNKLNDRLDTGKNFWRFCGSDIAAMSAVAHSINGLPTEYSATLWRVGSFSTKPLVLSLSKDDLLACAVELNYAFKDRIPLHADEVTKGLPLEAQFCTHLAASAKKGDVDSEISLEKWTRDLDGKKGTGREKLEGVLAVSLSSIDAFSLKDNKILLKGFEKPLHLKQKVTELALADNETVQKAFLVARTPFGAPVYVRARHVWGATDQRSDRVLCEEVTGCVRKFYLWNPLVDNAVVPHLVALDIGRKRPLIVVNPYAMQGRDQGEDRRAFDKAIRRMANARAPQ